MRKIRTAGDLEIKKKKRKKMIKIGFMIFGSILVIILLGLLVFGGIYVINRYSEEEVKVSYSEVIVQDVSLIRELDVDVNAVSLIVKHEGNNISLTHHEFIDAYVDGDEVVIKERDRKWYERVEGVVVLTIPEGFNFDSMTVESAAGKVEFNSITTRKLELELGAGKVILDNVLVTGSAEIDGGAGKIEIKNGCYNNMLLEMGVGKLEMMSKITGQSKIKAGIGACDIKLIGVKDDYKIQVEKGIGDIIIGNYVVSDKSEYGLGNNILKIEGGVGGIIIKYVDNEGNILEDIYEKK